ncbi:uncharacterized protein LOC111025019 [Momordica charantia]|uniref:Uncharacterized protein LOC111025019 n=1 Tax=Momordica charantia TaxID=3673 RepID=A0A6J1E196_MOMCH|nr:uncharacterized protein LOC111025019 [Momordica charantia]
MVDWCFLDVVLLQKGFGKRWRMWIKGCVSSANFSVFINGRPRGKIFATRGLRQGDPLSPFLFTLIGDSFSRLVNFCCERRIIQGFAVGRERIVVSHLRYADDTIIFCPAYKGNLDRWWALISLFIKGSGLRINLAKTSLIGINIGENEATSKVDKIGCRVERMSFRYLGLPLGGNHRVIVFWRHLVEKAPVSITKEMNKIVRDLFWSGATSHGCKNLVKWDISSLPMKLGGLGIGAFPPKNNALLMKWLWHFTREENALWRRVIASIYGVDKYGWLTKAPKGKAKGRPWFDIAKNLSAFQEMVVFKANQGDRLSFWMDKWAGNLPLLDEFPDMFALSLKQNAYVKDCWNEENQTWDLALRRGLFD